jgi:NADH:ubiquinone oxidoreductase subunit E
MSTTVSAESAQLSEFASRLDTFLAERTGMRGPLIPVLQFAQEQLGYLPEDALRLIARRLDLSYSEVAGVVTFYSFFSTVPRGRYVIRVCLGTACYVRGGNDVLDAFKRELGIGVGMTTDDRLFSLDVGRCFGACGLAPVVIVNDDVHQRVKPSAVRSLLDSYRAEEEAV